MGWGAGWGGNINYLIGVKNGTGNNREVGCWPWDVCAGIVIAQEAGGIVTGSREVFEKQSLEEFGDVTEDILVGRKYIVVRAIGEPVRIIGF